MAEALLHLQHLTKSFGRVQALADVSLDIQEGEIFTLLGPSGCGKTTTLRCIAGLEHPDSGSITLKGRVIVDPAERVLVPPHRRHMGMVFQSYAIWPHKSVFENVAYGLQVRRVPRSEIQERVKRVLDLVGLQGLEDRQGPQLSGGQQQRVALARAIVYEPSVLLLDEPFSNLDAKLREQMRVQLKLLLKQIGTTAVFVTHDQVEALSLSHRLALMNLGRVEQVGTPKELYERPATPFVRDFLGTTMLLKGTAADHSTHDVVAVRLQNAPGATLLARVMDGAEIAQGRELYLAVRPEDIELKSADGPRGAPGELVATVDTLLFVGDHYECRVKLGEETLLVHAPRWMALREGEAVRLSVDPQGISAWPA